MKLNETAYVHKDIRKLCKKLEILSGMKLITDLGEDFEEVRFIDKYGYIIIDFWNDACFTLSHKLTKVEWSIIVDLLIDLSWLNLPNVRPDLFKTKNPCKNPHEKELKKEQRKKAKKRTTKTIKSSAKKH